MNWETKETLLIIANTESLYNTIILDQATPRDVVEDSNLFKNVDLNNINWSELNEEINEMRFEIL